MLNYHEATLTMIDYEGNNYQPDPRKPEQPTPHGDLTGRELDDWLNTQDFRPFGYEW